MINFESILTNILSEAPSRGTQKTLEYAIKNRMPVSFDYRGPRGEVLPGRRIKTELVASGLTKKGNLSFRGWVQPPSVSKKGFKEHGWRTFILDRISAGSIQVYEDEQFDNKRPGYKEGDDSSFSTTYVTSDWGTTPPAPQERKPSKTPVPKQEPEKQKLPEPKPKEKPSASPIEVPKREIEVFNDLKTKIKVVDNIKQISPDDFKNAIDDLYKKKMDDWKKSQIDLGGNTNAGEGTRRRIEKDSESDLDRLLKQDNIKIVEPSSEETVELQEQLNRIKTLIFF
jgi:hypothetical protein